MNGSNRSVLLIVDDESSVCRALGRLLSGAVDELLTAPSPREADTILRSRPVTHLVCDQWFGRGQPLGIEAAASWREQHPTINRVIVITGRDVEQIERPEGVDAVIPKTVTREKLLATLQLGKDEDPS